jgi:hypothetical protein
VTEAVAATLEAVVKIATDDVAPLPLRNDESYRITVDRLRRRLGLASTDTAAKRLHKLIDLGAIEENEMLRGKGRGSPRFFKIHKTSLKRTASVFPEADDVKDIFGGREGSQINERDERDEQDGLSHSSHSFHSFVCDPSPTPQNFPSKNAGVGQNGSDDNSLNEGEL